MPAPAPKKILLIRNDKIGDFMLAWPALALLKAQFPEADVTALVPAYTAPLARLCPWIDHIILDERHPRRLRDSLLLAEKIRQGHFDTAICLFAQTRTTLALWLAGVPCRIGPATKLAQLFLNRRLKQRRSRSAKPEYQYNCELVYFLADLHDQPHLPVPPPPYLKFDSDEIIPRCQRLRERFRLEPEDALVVLHPGTGGSAINLSPEQYARLAKGIQQNARVFFLLTAGPGEQATAQALSQQLGDTPHAIAEPQDRLEDFCRLLACADLFISGSTGPLHIAGALNLHTAAFYPARRSATALRWQTVNQASHRLAFSPDRHIDENDMQRIDIDQAARIISNRLDIIHEP